MLIRPMIQRRKQIKTPGLNPRRAETTRGVITTSNQITIMDPLAVVLVVIGSCGLASSRREVVLSF